MSDPVFLRNNISSTIYAEQMNSAQIQGQAAARERAVRIQTEALKSTQSGIKRLESSEKTGTREEDQEGSFFSPTYSKNAVSNRSENLSQGESTLDFTA